MNNDERINFMNMFDVNDSLIPPTDEEIINEFAEKIYIALEKELIFNNQINDASANKEVICLTNGKRAGLELAMKLLAEL